MKSSRNSERPSPRKTLGELLATARARQFVGRRAELEVFESGASQGEPAWRVMAVHGPGGIGKSALLDAFERAATARAVPVLRLDCRDVAASPAAFLRQLAEVEGGGGDAPKWNSASLVLLLDTTEVLAPLTRWLWQTFVPSVPEHVRVVMAGRTAPPMSVRGDPVWRSVLRTMQLQPLAALDVQDYLERSGVDRAHGPRVFAATQGYPLALSLLVDSVELGAEIDLEPLRLDEHRVVVQTLLERFVDGLEDRDQRLALVACAHARRTTEDLLREAVNAERAEALFSWLQRLGFVESGRDGLFPHDVAREVFDADLRWRAPSAYVALHARIRSHLLSVARTRGNDEGRASGDLLFLHRTNPRMRPFIEFASIGEATASRLGDEDRAAILDMARAHEGERSAALVAHWMDRQPESFEVYRGAAGEVMGFGALLALHRASERDIASDPGTRAIWSFLQGIRRTQPHEAVMVFRFFMDRAAYQAPSASFNLFSMAGIRHILVTPNLAFSAAVPFADPEALAPMFADIDYSEAKAAAFEIDGRRFGGYFRDFGRSPVEAWLDLTARREIDPQRHAPAGEAPSESVTELDEAAFAKAVIQALKDLQKPDALSANPLCRSAAVRRVGAGGEPVEALVTAIRRAADELRRHPRDEKLYRVFDRTYLRPAETQQLAAERLGVPFSTYRRHLVAAVRRVTAVLWRLETGGEFGGDESGGGGAALD